MIRLLTLGALDLRGSSGEMLRPVLAQPRRAALLAYLALATPRGAHRRDTVLALFWPELETNRARNALGQAIHFLRSSIAADAIVNRNGHGLCIDWSNFWCDAPAFEDALDAGRVGEALALYRGDLLGGFHIADAPDFERWLESERARLAARYTKALETLAAERENAGDTHGAATQWRVLAARDPYSSRVILCLMQALRAAGDPAGAIVQARQHARLLREELGIAPDAEVAALVRQLQAEQPAQAFSVPVLPPARSASDHAHVVDPPAKVLPFEGAHPRRRTATLATVLLAVCGLAGAAVIKQQSSHVPDGPAPLAMRVKGAGDGVSKQAYLHDLYVRGRNAEASRSQVGLATAREAYERAIAADSTFALGYAGLAGVYGLLGVYGFAPLGPSLDSARMTARRALTLDSSRSETRTAVAITLADAGEFDGAEREFKRAINLNASDARAPYWYSILLVALGRGEDAMWEARRAATLDPLSPKGGALAIQRHAQWLITGKRPHFQLPPMERRRPILKLEPGEPWARARQAEDLAQAGQCAEARLDIERAQQLAPDNVKMRPFMGRVELWCGSLPRARELLNDMKRRPDARDNSFDIALLHTVFLEKDSAFVWLESHQQWTVIELAMLSAAPYLDPLRADPRFSRLLRELRLRK